MSDTTFEEETLEIPLTYEEERGKPMPSRNHGIIQSNLIGELLKHREFRVISELTLELGGRTYTPDLCIYRRQPADFFHDETKESEPPLVTVEILSPTQGYGSIMEKVDAYFQHGVKSCWVVFPPGQNLTIHTPGGGRHTFAEGTATDPTIGVTADLAVVFS